MENTKLVHPGGDSRRRTKKQPRPIGIEEKPLEETAMSTRSVELFRGSRGFGFTLSGQGPCVLSNIIPESPAGRAGLQIGDLVLEANGRNVSVLGHDDVVNWIAGSGHSGSSLKLQIGFTTQKSVTQIDSRLGLQENSTIKPPPFPSFVFKGNANQMHRTNSSSEDEIPIKKGHRERSDFLYKQNNEIANHKQHDNFIGYKPAHLSESRNFVASDDEGHILGIDSLKPPPRLAATEDSNRKDKSEQPSIFKHPRPPNKTSHQVGTNNTSQHNFPFGFPKPIHVRGHSEDSTLTDGSSWFPSPAAIASRRPKRHSPKKKASRLSQEKYIHRPKHPSPRKLPIETLPPQATHCQLDGSEELQLLTESEISSFLHPTLDELRKSLKLHRDQNPSSIDLSKVILKVVVGYLGTIEMPKQETILEDEQDSSPSISLQAIRNCIRRLRVEKKVHTTVLMCIFPQSVILLNHHGIKLAEYPSNQIAYCGMCTDDKRFLGLVTTRKLLETELLESEEEEGGGDQPNKTKRDVFSSSCHVFMTETAINIDESELRRRAKAFQFEPTKIQNSSGDAIMFVEFPWNAESIRQAIMSVYGRSNQTDNQHELVSNDPGRENERESLGNLNPMAAGDVIGNLSPGQQSNTSSSMNSGTTRTSNSDSGIGFKDEMNSGGANVIQAVAQINHEEGREHLQSTVDCELQEKDTEGSTEKFDVRAMPLPDIGSDKLDGTSNGTVSNENMKDREVESLFDIVEDSFNTGKLESQNSAENIRQSMQKYLHSKHEHLRRESEQLASTQSSDDKISSKILQSDQHENQPKMFRPKNVLPPYLNPPTYSPVSSSSDLIQRRTTCALENLSNSPLNSAQHRNGILRNDKVSSNHGISTIMNEMNNCARSLEDLREPENPDEVGDSDIMYERDVNSGYSCSAGSSLSREYKPEGHILRSLHGEYTRDNMMRPDDIQRSNETRNSKHGSGRFRLPAFAHKSDSNLSQIIGEVESCIGIPSSASSVSTANKHQFFLRNSGSNLPDPRLLLPNTANPKANLILRPCDQYPSEPGVLKSRPLSSLSAHSSHGGGSMAQVYGAGPQSTFSSHDEEGYDSENGVFIKPSKIVSRQQPSKLLSYSSNNGNNSNNKGNEPWSRSSSLRGRFRRKSASNSRLDQDAVINETNVDSSGLKISLAKQVSDEAANSIVTGKCLNDNVKSANSVKTEPSGREMGVDIGRVGAWATDFEKLLSDPVGLRTFTEFLKKEFSHENIYFWSACERYRQLTSVAERRLAANEIVSRHLSSGAPDPVNVDSVARHSAHESLGRADPNLFATAQKQIYNLMKFDSFSRFLKSDLYKESLMAEMAGKALPMDTVPSKESSLREDSNNSDIKDAKKKLSTQNSGSSESSRRRSLLPSWHNLKVGGDASRSKSKDRDHSESRGKAALAAAVFKKTASSAIGRASSNFSTNNNSIPQEDKSRHSENCGYASSVSNTDQLDTTGESRTSTQEQEVDGKEEKDGGSLARVILPDKATTVVQTKSGETIRSLVARLLDKRGLRYTSFDVFPTNGSFTGDSSISPERPLDLAEDSVILGCSEVRVEPRVLFRLELPSKKSIGVKAKPAKVVRDVLGPILAQYGWSLESMLVTRDVAVTRSDASQQVAVNMEDTVAAIDNCRLLVQTKVRSSVGTIEEINRAINSKVLEDLLRRKSNSTSQLSSNDAHGSGLEDDKISQTESSVGSSSIGKSYNKPADRKHRSSLSSSASKLATASTYPLSKPASGELTGSAETDTKKMPPPLTIPYHGMVADNLRNQNPQPHNSNNNTNTVVSQQRNPIHGFPVMAEDLNPHLSSRFSGSGRQSSSSFASAGVSASDELYEGLKGLQGLQRGRLEDQRGTEIKFEMPDFLKREQQNKENWGPMPPKYFPSDHQLPSNISTNNGSVHLSRQSEPLPYPPTMNSYNRLVPFPAGSRFSGNTSQGRFPTSNIHGNAGMESKEDNATGVQQFDYALLQQPSIRPGYPSLCQSSENSFGLNEGSMFSEGRIPSYQEAEMLFNPNDTTSHFNESRLSFGMTPTLHGNHAKDPMYETLSRYTGQHMGRWSNASISSNHEVSSRKLNSVLTEEHGMVRPPLISNSDSIEPFHTSKKVPPPLPPKPRLGSNRSVQSDIGCAPYQYSSGTTEKRPSGIYLSGEEVDIDERGYSVSFV